MYMKNDTKAIKSSFLCRQQKQLTDE